MQHHILWWNCENLFDVEQSKKRPEWVKKAMAADLKGWTKKLLDQKIKNLTSIIARTNDGKGPDILGVCEIENEVVLQLLSASLKKVLKRDYKVLHKDTKDERGIDVAFLYDKAKYTDDGKLFSLEIMKRTATRDLVQVHLKTKHKNELVLIGNHWPSRMGGQYESEPYRIMVAESLSYWIERIHQERGEDPSIVLMGDFNDNPFDRSITNYLLGTGNVERVKNARNHVLFNPMYSFLDQGIGTHVFGSEQNLLDQFMLSKSLLMPKGKFSYKSCRIVWFDGMTSGEYKTPVRFGLPKGNEKKNINTKGYSDHLPIEMILEEN